MRTLIVTALAGLALLGGTATLATAPADAQQAKPRPWTSIVVRTPEGVRQGNPAAKVKLIEYGSRSCPTCALFGTEGVGPLRKYIASGKVSYEFREYWVHPQDPGLSLVGLCVPNASFFSLLDEMYARQPEFNGRGTDAMYNEIGAMPVIKQPEAWARRLGYVELLTKRGVPAARINQCLTDLPQLQRMETVIHNAAKTWGVQGTPTFFVNGKRLDNVVVWSDLEPVLKANGG